MNFSNQYFQIQLCGQTLARKIKALSKRSRATKLVPKIRNWSYKNQLLRSDLIQFFKLSKEINQLSLTIPLAQFNSLFQTGLAQRIRGNMRKISGPTLTN